MTERVSVPWVSLAPLSLVQFLTVPQLLLSSKAWHIIHTKADAIGITQRVTPFMEWLRTTTGKPKKGTAALTSVDLVETTLEQRQRIQT